MNSSNALVPDFFTPIRRTSGSRRAERFCGLTNRYLNELSFLLSSSVKDTIRTTLPKIIWVSSDDEGVELLMKLDEWLCWKGFCLKMSNNNWEIHYPPKCFMNARQQAGIEQIEEVKQQHTCEDCHKKCSIWDINDFHVLNYHFYLIVIMRLFSEFTQYLIHSTSFSTHRSLN